MPRKPGRPRIMKLGNGFGFLIPKPMLSQLRLEEGSYVDLTVHEDSLVVRRSVSFDDKVAMGGGKLHLEPRLMPGGVNEEP